MDEIGILDARNNLSALVERVEKGDVRQRGVGLHGEERTIFDLTGHGVAQDDDITIKGRAAIAQGV